MNPTPNGHTAEATADLQATRAALAADKAYTTDAEIRALITDTCRLVGQPDAADLCHFSWGRFYRAAGDCIPASGAIRFSKPVWPIMTPIQRRETIIHEVCHYTAFLAGERPSHGPLWRIHMSRAGARAHRGMSLAPMQNAIVAMAFCTPRRKRPQCFQSLAPGTPLALS